jgi:hypothetical protein
MIARIKNINPKKFPLDRMLSALWQGFRLPTVFPKITASPEKAPPTILEPRSARKMNSR